MCRKKVKEEGFILESKTHSRGGRRCVCVWWWWRRGGGASADDGGGGGGAEGTGADDLGPRLCNLVGNAVWILCHFL